MCISFTDQFVCSVVMCSATLSLSLVTQKEQEKVENHCSGWHFSCTVYLLLLIAAELGQKYNVLNIDRPMSFALND